MYNFEGRKLTLKGNVDGSMNLELQHNWTFFSWTSWKEKLWQYDKPSRIAPPQTDVLS